MAINSVNNPLSIFSAILLTMCLMPIDSLALELSELASPASGHSAQPHLSRGVDGSLLLSWLEHADGQAVLRYSSLNKAGWQAASTVASGSDWFVNWADFPSVMPVSDSFWAAHWLHKRPGGTYAYNVTLAISNDAGHSWSEPFSPHHDGTPTEHGFVSLFPWQDGLGAVWLDGRNMTPEGHAVATDRPIHETGMTLRSAVITATGELRNQQLVDGLVCDCCQTDVAVLPTGPVVVYRNRNEQEIRDIYVTRAIDGRWRQPVAVNDDHWEIAGCPVNGPAIAAQGQQVAVAWYTGANEQPRVRLAVSDDGARTFGPAIEIDAQQPAGRVDVELLADGSSAVIWMCTRNKAPALCLRRVSADGGLGAVKHLEGIGKPGGFPQMMQFEDQLILAWVESGGDKSQVKTARLPITSF